jgi:pyridoxamine 5'-phosphate oxidase
VPPDTLLSPADILSDIWTRLAAGCAAADHPFRTAALATSDRQAGIGVRMVVLRKVEPEDRALIFHTDRRSPKFATLQREPACALLFYDPADKLQLRIKSAATLHTVDAIADDLWAATPAPARAMYASPHAPGTRLSALPTEPPAPQGDGRDHFAAVRCTIDSIDWLYLHHAAHRRVLFHFEHGTCTSSFIAP